MQIVKVLLVDDMPGTMQLTLSRALSQCGASLKVEWRTVKDGMDAIPIIEEWKPDCIISDVQMEKMDGLELAFWSSQKFLLPILLITGSRLTLDLLDEARKHGADHILEKPVRGEHLAAWLRGHAREEGGVRPPN